MNRITDSIAAAALACAASIQVQAGEPAQARDELLARADLSSTSDARIASPRFVAPGVRGARAAAAQGPDALRRYVERTRTIHALRYDDFAPR